MALPVLALLGLAASLLLAPVALGASSPKVVINTVGAKELGETGGRFSSAQGVSVNRTGAGEVPAGTFYIADSNNKRVQRLSPTGDFVGAWGLGVLDGSRQPEVCSKALECRRGLDLTDAGALSAPQGIAVDQSSGLVYVADPSTGLNRIDVFSAKGDFVAAFGLGVLGGFNSELEVCTLKSGCGQSAAVFAAGQGGAFLDNAIGDLEIDSEGNVYVANEGYSRVDVFKPIVTETGISEVEFIRSVGWGVNLGNEEFEVCTVAAECKPGLAGSGLGQFASGSPTDVAVDSTGNLFVLDAGNGRIQELDSSGTPLSTSFGSAALEAVFGAGAPLFDIEVDPSEEPNHLLVSGARSGSGDKVAVAELDHSGDNSLGAGKAHGEDLTVVSSNGLAAAGASLGGNLYLPTETVATLRGAFVLGDAPEIEPITVFTNSTALFKGKVVSNEINVEYHFEYSVDGKNWIKVPSADISQGAEPGLIEVEQEASGLTGSQLYRVRLVQNRPEGGGVATSGEVTFTTLAAQPVITGVPVYPVGDTSATFNAYLDPQNEETTFHFEYGLDPCSAGTCSVLPAMKAGGGGPRLISQAVESFQPATRYHYRLVATNGSGTTIGPDRVFETFAPGRGLPDDRAYELVTPSDTGAVTLAGIAFGEGARDCFDLFPATADGNSVISSSKGGSLAGLPANGQWDLYESVRGPEGWTTASRSALGSQSTQSVAGLCASPDHLYSTLGTAGTPASGSLIVEGKPSNYIRNPDGSFDLVGQGTVASAAVTDPEANVRWVTDKAEHIVFTSQAQLDDEAPASGTEAIYDRSPGGATQVLSLLPGNVTPASGQNAQYQGTSQDGSTVAFKLAGTMYVRADGVTEPVIADNGAIVGTTLRCSTTASATTKGFQWLRDGAPIGGATSSSYTVAAADSGKAIQCQVFALNPAPGGSATQVSNPAVVAAPPLATAAPTAPGNIAAPTGNATVGSNLSCTATGSWGGAPTFTRQWYRNGVPIAGATGTTYTVTAGDVTTPATFQCAVTGTNAGGSVTKVSANKNTPASPNPPGAPSPAPTATAVTVTSAAVFSGLSQDGGRAFYEHRGNLFAFEVDTESTTQITGSGTAKLVNVSEDGSHAYFTSTSVLTGTEENSQGQEAAAGQNNLYAWSAEEDETRFVTKLDPNDVQLIAGVSLTRWSEAVGPNATTLLGRGSDPSRTTPDGSVLLFESRARVSGYDSDSHVEIYRYDALNGDLACVSCPSIGVPAAGNARLQPFVEAEAPLHPTNALIHLQNVTSDGETVFFHSQDALVPGDHNGTWDVYEWKLGQQPYPISSGQSPHPSYLYAMTPDGSDVFFTASERLIPEDLSSVPSIYDARTGGGFAAKTPSVPCQGDACQGSSGAQPRLPGIGSESLQGPGNATQPRQRCAAGKQRVRRNGRTRCVKKGKSRAKKHQKRRANHHRRAGR